MFLSSETGYCDKQCLTTSALAQYLMTTNTSNALHLTAAICKTTAQYMRLCILICIICMCVCFIVEYASGGSLFDYLSSAESEDISMKQIMTWAMDIAKGIINMHTPT